MCGLSTGVKNVILAGIWIFPGFLDRRLYERFQQNDRTTALEYGCCKEILSRNKAEALWEQVEYDVEITKLPLLQTQLSQKQYKKTPSEYRANT